MMGASLTVYTLGRIAVETELARISTRALTRRTLFLIYLAEQQEKQSRTHLATLFWPKVDSLLAMRSLRMLLTEFRQAGLETLLLIGRFDVQLNPAVSLRYDAAEVRAILPRLQEASLQELRAVADLYQGPFLVGEWMDHYPLLDEWAFTVRAEVDMAMVTLLIRLLAMMLEQENDVQATLAYARTLVDLAPYDDNVQLLFCRALAGSGQIAEALRHIKAYRRMVEQEVDALRLVAPALLNFEAQLERPSDAARLVVQHRFPHAPVQTSRLAPAMSPLTVLPANVTPLIGRQQEQAILYKLLAEGHRLISIVGIGGAGKTFFIRSQFQTLATHFPNGVFFVDLRGVEPSEEMLLSTIAAALQISSNSQVRLLEQIISVLDHGTFCLILDNYEPFLPTSGPLIVELLEHTRFLQVIITSRKQLSLSLEAVLLLDGLQIHEAEGETQAPQRISPSAAVLLFTYSAQQIMPYFAVDETNHAQIAAICRQVGGLPLAIQLAASQVNFYSLDELVQATAQNFDILADERTGRPSEHHSMVSVLETTWASLSHEAQHCLMELSLFATSWDRLAMMAIAPTTLAVYRELLTISLLQNPEPRFFSLHPLVKRFAALRAGEHIDLAASARYSDYFLKLLDFKEPFLQRTSILNTELFATLQRYQADLFSAWRLAVKRQEWSLLHRTVCGLVDYMAINRQNNEGVALLRFLLQELPSPCQTPEQAHLAAITTFLIGVLYTPHPDFQKGVYWRAKGIDLLDAAGTPYERGSAYVYHANALLADKTKVQQSLHYLQQAKSLADEYRLSYIQLDANLMLSYHAIYWGDWLQVQSLDEQIGQVLKSLKDFSPQTLLTYCQIPLFFDRWNEVDRRLQFSQKYFSDNSLVNVGLLWLQIYQGIMLAAMDHVVQGISIMESALPQFTVENPGSAPIFWGYLALYQAYVGDWQAALETADYTRMLAEKSSRPVLGAQGTLHTAAAYILTHKLQDAGALLREALGIGLAAPNTPLAFTALYYLARLHETQLARPLFEKIVQIACVSPAMYAPDRLPARQHAAQQGIVVSDADRAALWSTDFAAVQALVEEIKKDLPGVLEDK